MMVKVYLLFILFSALSCVQQQGTVSDVNQVAKKFDVNDEENYLLFEGRTLEILDININKTSQELSENVTYSCFYDQVVNNIVLNTTSCSSLPGLTFDSDDGTIIWTPGYDNYSSDQTFEFKVIATDGLFSDSETFLIKLIDQNRAPTLPFFAQSDVDEEATLNLDFYDSTTFTDIDPDGDAIFYGCAYEHTAEKFTNLSAGQISAINALRSIVDSATTQAQYDAAYQNLINYVSNFSTSTPAVWFDCSVLDGMVFNTLTGGLSWTPNKNNQNENKTYRIRITATDGTDSDINYYSILVKDINTPVEITEFSDLDTYSFSDVIYTYERVPIEPIRFSAKVNLSASAGTSGSSSCFFDTTIDGSVATTLPCSLIGISFDSNLDRFDYDDTVNNPSDRYEIRLTRGTETAIFVVDELADIESIDDDGDAVTFNCYYDTTVDASVANTNLCSDIGVDLNVNTGQFEFTPPSVASDTTYEFKILVKDGLTEDETIFSVVVRDKSKFEFKSIDFGANHTCALSMAHEIYCWGDNTYGQLGTGDNIYRRFPFKLTVDNSNSIRFRELKTFTDHTCALSYEGDLYCWGRNDQGQLGTGDNVNKNLLQKVDFPASNSSKIVFDFAVGEEHTCIINSASKVYCWGDNTYGQLGIGSSPDLNEMGLINVNFSAFSYYTSYRIEAGAHHTCALHGNGRLYCWGRNDEGQLGVGDNIDYNTPQFVLENVYHFELGENHSCYNHNDTGVNVSCAGDNAFGQLADGSTSDSNSPVAAAAGFPRYLVKVGRNHTCSADPDTNTEATCYGDNSVNQLGTTGAISTNDPAGTDVSARLFVGNSSNCLLVETGMLCWGENGDYQFFSGSTSGFSTPSSVSLENLGITEDYITSVNLGERLCFSKMSGEAYCADLAFDIDSDLAKAINLFPPINHSRFDKIIDHKVVGSSNGVGHYVTRDRSIHLYGANDNNWWDNSGSGFIDFFDSPVSIASKAQDLTSYSSDHMCFLEGPGLYYTCSGDNDNFEIGDNTTADVFDFTHSGAPGPAIRVRKVVSGKDHSCALSLRNEIYCWGSGAEVGQGAGGVSQVPTLIDTSEFANLYFIDVFAGDDMTCALSDKRELYCFGDYYDDDPVTKVILPSGVYFRDIKISSMHFCALSFDGETYCWGDNSSGQIGNGSTTNQLSPTRITLVSDPINKFFDIAVHDQNSCAINFQGELFCWGENGSNMRYTNLVEGQVYLSPQLYVPQN